MLQPGEMGYKTKRPTLAHRVAYHVLIGPIPNGFTIDHLCHNQSDCPGGSDCVHRLCTNPKHLEAVSLEENKARGKSLNAINARKTHCHRGHKFTPENTRVRHNGSRGCRTCDRMFAEISNAAKRRRK